MEQHFESKIRKLAIPIILMQLVNVLMTMVDQLMMGTYDETAVSAVSWGGQYRMLIMMLIPIVAMGAGIKMNQAFGAKQFDKAKQYSTVNFILSNIFAISIFVIVFIGAKSYLKMINTPSEIFDGAYTYMIVTSFYLLFQGLISWISTHLQMIGKTKPMLYAIVTMQIANISLNYLLIFGNLGFPEMGIKGSALATLISTIVGSIVFLYFGIFRHKIHLARKIVDFKNKSIELIKIGFAKSFEPLVWTLATTASVAAVGKLGLIAVLGFTYARMLTPIATAVSAGIGRASSIISGYFFGIGDYKNIRITMKRAMIVSAIAAAIVAGLLVVVAPMFARLFTDNDEVVKTVTILALLSIPFEVFRVGNIVGVHGLAAANDIKYLAIRAPIVMVIFIAIIPLVIVNSTNWGLYAIYASLILDEGIRSIIVLRRIKTVKFHNKDVHKYGEINILEGEFNYMN